MMSSTRLFSCIRHVGRRGHEPSRRPPPAPLLPFPSPRHLSLTSSSTSTSESSTNSPPPSFPPPPTAFGTSWLPPTSAYLHLPFCKRKCLYCDFPVTALGRDPSTPTASDAITTYVNLLLDDLHRHPPPPNTPPLRTIFFGGGTPSLIPPVELGRILSALRERPGIDDHAEISMEIDPGTFTRESLSDYLDLGVTRVSVGVQSFEDDVLAACGRSHDVAAVRQALEDVTAVYATRGGSEGIVRPQKRTPVTIASSSPGVPTLPSLSTPNQSSTRSEPTPTPTPSLVPIPAPLDPRPFPFTWSLDLMSGLPHLKSSRWAKTIQTALSYHPPHISVYDLQVEAGTPFGSRYVPGSAPLPSDMEAGDMLRVASQLLRDAGYEHYEVSSYARPGHRCEHNQMYWNGSSYLAYGVGAASYLFGERFARPRSLTAYREWVLEGRGTGESMGQGQGKGKEPNLRADGDGDLDSTRMRPDDEEVLLDMVMLRLRTRDGLELREVQERFGEGPAQVLTKAVEVAVAEGGAEWAGPTRVRLTDPEGLFRSNDIISDLFCALDRSST